MTKLKNFTINYRPLKSSDLGLRTSWQNNPEVAKNLGWQIRKGTTLEEARSWYEGYSQNENDQRFIIEADNKPIGIVGLTDINPLDKNAMLYIIIGEDGYRGKGIGRKACEHIINYGFKELKLHKIYLEVNSYNKPALSLYKSLGFTEEGVFKEQILLDGAYFDEIYMGLLSGQKKDSDYHTVIVDKSLKNVEALERFEILSKTTDDDWTMYKLSIAESDLDSTINFIQTNMQAGNWYFHAYNEDGSKLIVVFKNKVFKTDNNPRNWQAIIDYGASHGTPKEQLDFVPNTFTSERY